MIFLKIDIPFKGTVSGDFLPPFFSWINSTLGPDSQPIGTFCKWPRIRRKNWQYSNFSRVNDPNETVLALLTPAKRFLQGHWPSWNDFSGVIYPAETTIICLQNLSYEINKLFNNSKISCKISAGSLTPQKRFQLGHWSHWNDFSGVFDPSEISNRSFGPTAFF
jgi:hypothetical protein